jgi:uncharacterized membrane protein
MAVTSNHLYHTGPHPIHGVLLAGTVHLFLGALLSDIAYWLSYEIQWSNFASWLIVGGLIFAGLALLFAIVDLFRSDDREHNTAVSSPLVYFLLLLATWVLGFINALVHAKDVWAIMPAALILSVIIAILALLATGIGFLRYRRGGAR